MVTYLVKINGKTCPGIVLISLDTKCGNCDLLEIKGFTGECGKVGCDFNPDEVVKAKLCENLDKLRMFSLSEKIRDNQISIYIEQIEPDLPFVWLVNGDY
jgi:hypothetical protein